MLLSGRIAASAEVSISTPIPNFVASAWVRLWGICCVLFKVPKPSEIRGAEQVPGIEVTEEHIRRLVAHLPAFRKETAEVEKLLQTLSPERRGRIFSADFSWSLVYELPMPQHLILIFGAMGYLGIVERVVRGQEDALGAMLSFMEEVIAKDDEPEWSGGDGGMFKEEDVVGLTVGLIRQFESVQTFGKYLSELVEDVRGDKDESFFKAIRVDRTVMSCPTFAARLARAELQGDKEFFRLLGNALKGRWEKPWDSYNDARVLLQILHEGKLLDTLSVGAEANRLFIDELKVYSARGKDPEKGLERFINRWKANKFNS